MAVVSIVELRLGVLNADSRRRRARAAYLDELLATVPVLDYDLAAAEAYAELLVAVRPQAGRRERPDHLSERRDKATGHRHRGRRRLPGSSLCADPATPMTGPECRSAAGVDGSQSRCWEEDAARCRTNRSGHLTLVGGHRNVLSGGQLGLPAHGHEATQRGGLPGAPLRPERHLCGRSNSLLQRRSCRDAHTATSVVTPPRAVELRQGRRERGGTRCAGTHRRAASRWPMSARNVSGIETRIHSGGSLRPGPPASI